ncbi:acetyl-CoA carboxylase biotin carboxyl carrier protein subunit [Pseudomonas shirazica]|nr:acetyl-CoA carboxylase biotin carboxyl carrier protein subunit [Pseudomonas shirazica]
MDPQRIKEFIDLVKASDLTDLSFSEGGSTLHLKRYVRSALAVCDHAEPHSSAQEPSSSREAVRRVQEDPGAGPLAREVRSPLFGVLHLTPSPEEPEFVTLGSEVQAGQALCIIEAMKMFHTVRAEKGGIVEVVCARSGDEVDSGQVLFKLTEV